VNLNFKMSANEVDVENSAATSEAHLEKIETQADHDHHSIPHELLKTKSTHPLELIETHRTYSGWRWILVCFALYSKPSSHPSSSPLAFKLTSDSQRLPLRPGQHHRR
jgi:hypothetical protein